MKTVAICGIGDSLESLNFFRKDIEIWGLNHHYHYFRRWDLWFDVHRRELIPRHVTQSNYPLESAIQLRGHDFYCTAAYMLAYAILQKYERIEIYGVDLVDPEEMRFGQRDCTIRWINFAKESGIDVFVTPSSPLLRTTSPVSSMQESFLYGYNGIRPKV